MSLRDWVASGNRLSASDLHVEADTPLVMRIRGELATHGDAVPAEQVVQAGRELLGEQRWSEFLARGSADLSANIASVRCRVNVFKTVRGVAIAVRLLTSSIRTLEACNLHPDLRRFTYPHSGLIVLSGPTGCGKSTTLAALVEEINSAQARNILTIESPIEHLFANRRSFIRQREVPTHSPSYEQAIVDALREDPDVLVIGEMRTPEVMRLTLNAAETGHLVITTMHSATCAEALYRISMSFPAEIQGSIRAQLADCLVGVVCQQLEFIEAYGLLVPRCEVLTASSGAKGTIRAGQFSHIANVLQSGGDDGMWTFDRYQRWMQQKRDWVQPAATPAPAVPQGRASEAALTSQQPVRPPGAPSTDPSLEITIDDDVDLAEIARKVDDSVRRR
ncbi:MAG TPA: ATPase, T2SS/T4P/T4SS family [Steroidobacteraceae bacterium]|nr:ATPase, T2SS/T4P/T4SS family [Steroidobacteraceae bacterium]